MKIKLFTPFIFLSIITFAQDKPQNYTSSITIDELKDHMYYLASDALKGRMPGEDGYQKAVEYVVSQFKQSNLKPLFIDGNGDSTYLQKISFEKYIWDNENNLIIQKKKEKNRNSNKA